MYIVLNRKMKRYEVFDEDRGVVRNGELQPVFVSADRQAACDYMDRVLENEKARGDNL